MFSCLQNKDGQKDEASGRTKNPEQSSAPQHVKDRKPEEIRKQRVNISKSFLIFEVTILIFSSDKPISQFVSLLASGPPGQAENLERTRADEEEEFAKLSE